MIDKKRIFFLGARIIFIAVFIVVSFGFLAWEANGLITWNSNNTTQKQAVKMEKYDNTNKAALGEGAVNDKKENSDKVVAADARPVIIKKYLEKYKSPLLPYSDLIFELSETYGYDYRWIVAIAQQESNLCKKIPEGSHNCWGYGINSKGTLKFDSYELALKSYAEYLKRQYFDKGLTTPETIMKKYCPSSNGSWAYGVRHFMDDMENGNFL